MASSVICSFPEVVYDDIVQKQPEVHFKKWEVYTMKKNKLLALALSGALTLGLLAGCGGGDKPTGSTPGGSTPQRRQ